MTKILSVNRKSVISMKIHPEAEPAFQLHRMLPLIFDNLQLPQSIYAALQGNITLHVVKGNDGNYLLISGFEQPGFSFLCASHQDVIIVLHQDISEEKISDIAWNCVLKVIVSSINIGDLEAVRTALNTSLPKEKRIALFGKAKLSQNALAKLTTISRDGLAKQAVAINKRKTPNVPKQASIFDLLTDRD